MSSDTTTITDPEEEIVPRRKLSELIRKGMEIAHERNIKQLRGRTFEFNYEGELGGCCALGMAYLGSGTTIYRGMDLTEVKSHLCELGVPLRTELPVPDGIQPHLSSDCRTLGLSEIVIGLNDLDNIQASLDEIVAWLEANNL